MVTLATIISHLYPSARPLADYIIADDGSGPRLAYFSESLGTPPTAEQIADATAAIESREAARSQLMAAFNALPRGVQVFFEATRLAVGKAIDANDWNAVREIIATTPTPNDSIEGMRLQFAAMIDQVLSSLE